MSKVVIFGLGKVAEVVHYYLTNHSEFSLAAFTCDRDFMDKEEFLGLPVVPFDEIEINYPPDQFKVFVALGYQQMNSLRADRVATARKMGYQTPSYIHPDSGIPNDTKLGENCFILNHVCIQPRVKIGDNVFVWGGALIGHHSTIGDNCWITSHANIAGSVKVGRNCFFAINATVANEVSIGEKCLLGANTLVTKNLDNGKVVVAPSSDIHRLDSEQFLRISRFR